MAPAPTILLVDDEPDILLLLQRFVQRLVPRAVLITTTNGEAALAQAQVQPITLAVVDYNMPGIKGIDVAVALLQRGRARTVAIVSAYHTPELERTSRMTGAAYLPKPLDLDRFEALVIDAIRHHV